MFYQNELQFLCDTLRKTHLQAIAVAPTELAAAVADLVPKGLPPTFPTAGFPLPIDLEPRTVYKLTDAFDLCYLYFALPEAETPTVLLVGPYLSTPYPSMQRTEEREQPVPLWQRNRAEYYAEIPVLTEGSPLFAMLSAFWERIWRGPSFAIVEIDNRHEPPASPINEPMQNDDFDDVLSNMKAMEKRYAFENEIMHAVSLGQLHKENQLFSPFFKQTFEQRLPDTLRNAKNYGVITNTLLRKAAEKGNVHPVYLDRVSSNFAARIEHMADPSKTLALMREMFRSYCRLVRKHALTSFSPIVQKVILLIDSNLSAPLSLHALAKNQNVSDGYLSAIFKKETGQTLSEYVREKRIRHAMHLLGTTHLQIQTVALHCGIMDVQYFSKTFKKLTGITPKEYRESIRKSQNR